MSTIMFKKYFGNLSHNTYIHKIFKHIANRYVLILNLGKYQKFLVEKHTTDVFCKCSRLYDYIMNKYLIAT